MKNKKYTSLTHQIPYYGYYQGITLLVDGSLSIGLKVQGVHTYTLPHDQLANLKSQFKNIFQFLPPGYHVQILHDYHQNIDSKINLLDEKITSAHPIGKSFKASYINHLKTDSNIYQADLYIFILCKPGQNKELSFHYFGNLAENFIQKIRKNKNNDSFKEENYLELYRHHHRELKKHADQIIHSFKTILGISASLLSEDEFYGLIHKLLNPGKKFIQKRTKNNFSHHNYFSEYMTLREYLSHSSCEVFSDKIKMNDYFYKILTLKVPSRFTTITDDEEILHKLDFPFLWSLSFNMIDNAKINSQLSLRQKRKHAFTISSNNPNIDSSLSKSEIERALADQKTEGFSWHEVSLSFLIDAKDEEVLENRSRALRGIFRDFEESVVDEEKYAQFKYFVATLPGCGHYNDRKFLFSSHNVADLAPLSTPPEGTEALSSYLYTHRNTLFRFSTFTDEFNSWNQVVIGKIGSGKSFIVNNLLNMALMSMDHPQVMILDLGKSFKKTTDLWGGKYITIDLDHPDCGLNPLPPHQSINPDGNQTVLGLLDFTVQLLLLMAGKKENNRLEARVLRKAIEITYQNIKERDPILTDLHHTLKNYKDFVDHDASDVSMAQTLAKLLEDYVYGAYSTIFNRPSSFNFQTNFFCFDFKEAHSNPHIREIATYVIGGYMSRKMTENSKPKFIIFDEFATTMQHETGAALCRMIAKNCRKHGVSFICISQELEDFLHNPAAQAVYHQSNYKWFLKMDDDLRRYQEHLRLTEEDIQIIQSLETKKGKFSEVYLFYGNKKALLSLKPDPLIYWACTRDASDSRMEEAYQRHFKDLSLHQILCLLAKKYPQGVLSDDINKDPVLKEGGKLCAASEE